MTRSLLTALFIIACLGTLSCQSYTSGLQQSSSRVDETTVVSNLKAVAQAQTAYSVSNSGSYGTLAQLVEGGFLDTRFAGDNPKLRGYVFTMRTTANSSGTGESSYTCNADPDTTANVSGRHFYLDSGSPVIRVNATQKAAASDEVLQP